MQYTDDQLRKLRKMLAPKGMEAVTGMPIYEWRALLRRLSVAERAVKAVRVLHKRCEQFAANPYPKIYGLDHEVGGNPKCCEGCDAVLDWQKVTGNHR